MLRESICCELPLIFSSLNFGPECNRCWVRETICLLYTKGAPAPTAHELGAPGGFAPTVYFNDPNKRLLEIRTYDRECFWDLEQGF